jgi:hypothetical protein
MESPSSPPMTSGRWGTSSIIPPARFRPSSNSGMARVGASSPVPIPAGCKISLTRLRRTLSPARPGPWAVSSPSIPRGKTGDPKPLRYGRLPHEEEGAARQGVYTLVVGCAWASPPPSLCGQRGPVPPSRRRRASDVTHTCTRGGRVPGGCGIMGEHMYSPQAAERRTG